MLSGLVIGPNSIFYKKTKSDSKVALMYMVSLLYFEVLCRNKLNSVIKLKIRIIGNEHHITPS